MNVPLVPELTRALVSTVFPSHKIQIGICIVLFKISASVTEYMERIEEADVEADLYFKNSCLQLFQ